MTRAVVVDPQVTGRLVLAEVEDPVPAPSEAVVRVAANQPCMACTTLSATNMFQQSGYQISADPNRADYSGS